MFRLLKKCNGMRDYRKISEKFEIRLTMMQILLSVTAGLIFCLLIFVMGFISGKRYAAKLVEVQSVRVKIPSEGTEISEIKKDLTEKGGVEKEEGGSIKNPQFTFYETLEKDKSLSVNLGEKAGYKYALQAGSFKNKKQAVIVRNKLRSRGYDANIVTAEIKGKEIWHRVRFGRFSSKTEAIKEAKKLEKELRIKAIVIPIEE